MKRILTLTCLALTLAMAGCARPNQPAQPTAPGYTNSIDQSMGETLAAARAFYNRIQADATSGTYKPTAAESQVLENLGQAINAAQPIYLAYHAGTGGQAAAQSAIDKVTQAQNVAQSQIQAVK
jgi:hypothetical protein